MCFSYCKNCGANLYWDYDTPTLCDECDNKHYHKELELQRSFQFHNDRINGKIPQMEIRKEPEPNSGISVVCPKCGHSWNYKGKGKWIQCKCFKSFKIEAV